MRFCVLAFAFTLLGVVAACSSSDGGEATPDAGVAASSACAQDSRKDVYVAGLTKNAGTLSVKVTSATPAPPQRDVNDLTLQLVDASGNPVDGATFTVVPWMPDHGHGSSVKPVITPRGGGTYDVTNLYFPMPGLWQITMGVTPPGAAAPQDAVFSFCIDG